MFLKLKQTESLDTKNAEDLQNGQLYVDNEGDVNLVVRRQGSQENIVICFCEYFCNGEIVLMDNPPVVKRLVTLGELEWNDE